MSVVQQDQDLELRHAYDELLEEVEFQCTLCEAVQRDISVLNATIEALYHKIVSRSKNAATPVVRVAAWTAGYFIADDILQAACWKKNNHQICGLDLSKIEEFHSAIRERLELLTGLTIRACN